ncbi:MAG: carboxyl transferase domain-containing protein, partial [Syntrophales bacterium]|nr:carboxyl transferase domain-containing protein [Syntrophales bacterium]
SGLASYGGGRRNTFIDHMSRVRKTPLVTAVLGKCYGEPTWMACLSDFVVMVKGTAMGVSGPRIVSIALGEKITDEELGGWELHSKVTGMADRVAENEDECMQIIREYLSYLPSHNEELPPLVPVPEGSGEGMPDILNILPEKRNRTYDMNQILRCIVDKDSLFSVKPLFGQTVITSFGRVGGRVVGFVANQPRFNSGAMDTDGIEKVMSFLCLCDSFNIPLIFMEDIPGFLVGREAERKRVGAHVMNFMNALGLVTVPKITVILRKAYGMAFWNMCGSGSGADSIVAWPTAEMSFVDPVIAANVVFGATPAKTPEEQEERVKKMAEGTEPYGAAGLHFIHDVIDPRETRNHIIKVLKQTQECSKTKGIGEHRLANWPTKF